MPALDFLDFQLQFHAAQEHYFARVLKSPAGEGSSRFAIPFAGLELENLLLRVSAPARMYRKSNSPALSAAKKLGDALFQAAFDGDIRGLWETSLLIAEQQGKGLRLLVKFLDCPALINLPWELLHLAWRNDFIALSPKTPVVRYLGLPRAAKSLQVSLPLQILAVVALPFDVTPLQADHEIALLQQALESLLRAGLVELKVIAGATVKELQNELRQNDYHILHFVGHGEYDDDGQEGVLLFEDEGGRSHRISGERLGILLLGHSSLRLTVLNACYGGRAGIDEPFSGIAQAIIQKGAPAVVAMQFGISDEAASTFTKEFYGALARGAPVDAAITETRRVLSLHDFGIEWSTPVLYMRSADGHLFAFSDSMARGLSAREPAEEKSNFERYFGDQVRLCVLNVLGRAASSEAQLTITDICRTTGVPKPQRKYVVEALDQLAGDHLVSRSKKGNRVVWKIADEGKTLLQRMSSLINATTVYAERE